MSVLKPCPFCGADANKHAGHVVACKKCSATAMPQHWDCRASGWIKVGERLPELGQWVLVYYPDGGIRTNKIYMADEDGPWWWTGELEPMHTHWMPLPEPPND